MTLRRRDPADRLLQRHVGADVRDRQVAGGQHHGEALHATRRGDQFGVTDEAWIAELRRFLVHRHRHDAGDRAGQCVASSRDSTYCRAAAPDAASMTPGR